MSTENQSNKKSKKKKMPVKQIPNSEDENGNGKIGSSNEIYETGLFNSANRLMAISTITLNLVAYRKFLAGYGYLALKNSGQPKWVLHSSKRLAASTKRRLYASLYPIVYQDKYGYSSIKDGDHLKSYFHNLTPNLDGLDFTKPLYDFHNNGSLKYSSLLSDKTYSLTKLLDSITPMSTNLDVYNSSKGFLGGFPSDITPLSEMIKPAFFKMGQITDSITSAWKVNDNLGYLSGQIAKNVNPLINGYNACSANANYGRNDWSKGMDERFPTCLKVINEGMLTYSDSITSVCKVNNNFGYLSGQITKNANPLINGYNAYTANANYGRNDWSKGMGEGFPTCLKVINEGMMTYPDYISSVCKVNNNFGYLPGQITKNVNQLINSSSFYTAVANNGVNDWSKEMILGLPTYLTGVNEGMKSPFFRMEHTIEANFSSFMGSDYSNVLKNFSDIAYPKLKLNGMLNPNLRAKDLTWNPDNGGNWDSITQIPSLPKKEEKHLTEKAIIKILVDVSSKFFAEVLEEILPQQLAPILNKMNLLEEKLLNAFQNKHIEKEAEVFQKEEYIDRLEVINMLKISDSTFYRECKKWNPHRVGNKSLFLRSEIYRLTKNYLK
jgi:hypothetical protein